ncbi:MAG TPA: DUF1570 domain-containing protein [Gemmataceae bacterium]|nr:DUF1570 domain-containing protein [Gemmataceae bacterium]
MSHPKSSHSRWLVLLLAWGWLLCAAGCHALRLSQVSPDPVEKGPQPPAIAQKAEFRVGAQFVFLPDFPINQNLPLFRELADLREQVYKELQLPPSTTPIYVHLFESRDRYEQFMKATHPKLPRRRAFFVAQDYPLGGGEKLQVYTYWGERINQDLRHELTHALLHSVLKDVPLWLDEGLAEYFEMPPGWRGVNYQHVALLCRGPDGPCAPNLARLEEMTNEMMEKMTPAEYREAWGFVHLMLHSNAEARRVLLTYLRELRTNARPEPLRPRLAAVFSSPDQALARHLHNLDRTDPPATSAQR